MHRGHVSTIRTTFDSILNGWFPGSDFEIADAPEFERYGEDFDRSAAPETSKSGSPFAPKPLTLLRLIQSRSFAMR